MNITEKNRTDIVAFSGGKDSVATLLLARERGMDVTVAFADTDNEHPILYEYLEYIEKKLDIRITRVKANFDKRIESKKDYIKKHWHKPLQVTRWGVKKTRRALTEEEIALALTTLKPTGNAMLDLFLQKGMMPTPRQKFCSIELKQLPMHEQITRPLIAAGKAPIVWQGVRAQESAARSKYSPIEETDDGVLLYRPILLWKHEDVFAMAKRHGVKPNPLYAMGMSRIGCMPCINCNNAELAEIARRFPEEIARIADWEKQVAKTSRHPRTREEGVCSFFPLKLGKDPADKTIYAAIAKAKESAAFSSWRESALYQAEPDADECSAIYPIVCE